MKKETNNIIDFWKNLEKEKEETDKLLEYYLRQHLYRYPSCGMAQNDETFEAKLSKIAIQI